MRKHLPYFISAGLFLALLISKFDPEFGFSELAGFGADYDRVKVDALQGLSYYEKPNSTGYDGQFYAQIALDPQFQDPLYSDAIDHPSYRARRILLPAVAHFLGIGKPGIVLQVHSLLNVAFLFAFAWLILRWAPPNSPENFARWFCCVFSMGALESVRYSLADLPAAVLALTVIAFLENNRHKSAFVANSLAALTKETSVIHAAFFLSPSQNPKPLFRRLLEAGLAASVAIIPLAIWMLYVSHRFPITVNASDNIELPFSALYRAFAESVSLLLSEGPSSRYSFRLLAILGLVCQGAYLLLRPLPKSRIWVMGLVYLILFVTLGDAVWRGYWAACRIALPLTVAFNLLIPAHNKTFFWSAMVLTNLSLLHGIIRWL